MEHVVIIGAGFGGLYAAKALRRAPVRVTVIDRHNHHTFQPLLYQVATAGLNASDIAAPIRRVLRRQKNTSVVLAEVKAIDPVHKRVIFDDGEIGYDTLVVAAGASHSYFGHDEWAADAPGLKTVDDALEIRRRILLAFEAAEREPDPARRRAWMTFVIVGAGPTGVELAGALTELARHTLRREFRHIDPIEAHIILLEGAGQVLPTYVPELGQKAREQLIELGVDVRTDALVTRIDSEGVSVGDKRIEAKTVLWGAGVAASALVRSLDVPLDRAGRVLVEPDLTVPGHEDIYVIGDLASLKQADGKPVPGVAPAAIQQGRHAARNIMRTLEGLPRLPFRYRDKGSLATIGRAAAVGDFGRVKLSGFTAWLAWLVIHIVFLIGFRSRVLVLFSWALSYLTYERGARLITGETPRLLEDRRPREIEPHREDGAARSLPVVEHATTRA
ncbi:NAD(P)/FAD-dependent oxidoreductase [Sorangium sp. So ce131]|uniref:NAD(P)/FAD-dependent oxidoreductase n=1 Tax=Sorangium sp. So ce131 TaxID=3133282 RepID=UPI003F62DC59